MKIRGNTVGTTIAPKKVLAKCGLTNENVQLIKDLFPDDSNVELQGRTLSNVGALQINPDLDTIGVWLNAEVPVLNEDGRPNTGALSFYDADFDRPVILRNVADGENDGDAATVGQLNRGLATKNSIHAVGGLELSELQSNHQLIKGDLYFVTDDEGTVCKGEILEAINDWQAIGKGQINDGFSPAAKVEKTATGATITITDKNGTTTATVGAPATNGEWELVETFDSSNVDFVNNDVTRLSIPYNKLQYKELYIIGYVTSKDTTSQNANLEIGKSGRSFSRFKVLTSVPQYFRAHCYLSPLNWMEVVGSASRYYYADATAIFTGYFPNTLEKNTSPGSEYIIYQLEGTFWLQNSATFGEATVIKVWGRK